MLDFIPILEDQNPWWREPAYRSARRYPVRRDLQAAVLKQILRRDDRRAVVLLGPRQVGKTVLLRQTADDLLDAGLPPGNLTYFDFSDERLTTGAALREVAETKPAGCDPDQPRVLLFDEVRLGGQWDRWLKQAVDAGGYRIAVSDSAASLLRDGARESGQGRWDEHRLEGLSFREFLRLQAGPEETIEDVLRRGPNQLERYLSLGGFPEHAGSDDPPEVRKRLRGDIAERAILRDLLAFGVEVQRVKDLFVYLVQDSGAEFNSEARASDLKADARTIRDWARLLTETLLVVRLDRFVHRATASLRSPHKNYAADHGLVAAFAAASPQSERVRAQIFEAVVFRHLREAAASLEGSLSYFRQSKGEGEIDFVLEAADEVIGVEVTCSTRIRPEKIEKLRRAGEALGAGRLLLIYGGSVQETAGSVQAVPLRTFLLDPVSVLGGAAR